MSYSSDLQSAPVADPTRQRNTQKNDGGKSFRWYHILIGVAALMIVALVLFVTIQPIQVLPRMTLAPGYAFTDASGNLLTSEDARGKITLYNFTYTGCEAPCPESGPATAAIQERIAAVDTGEIPVQLVTISFDPERDTPAAMAAWLAEQGADPAIWNAATGDPEKLKNVIGGGFGVYYGTTEEGELAFDPAYVLVDGNGIIRTKYRTATPDPETVARDLEIVTREVQNSSGAQKLAYEAAHLFLCYPD
jgi:protein SCO1/2